LSQPLTGYHQDPRSDASCRMIAYDEQLDVSAFLTERDRVFVHDGQTMSNWTLANPKEELRDWLPPVHYDLAMDALSRYSLRT
jgi:hypothetical protein